MCKEIISGIKCLGAAETKRYPCGDMRKLYYFECPYCGKVFKCPKKSVMNKNTKSCGCLHGKLKKYTSSHPLYKIRSGILRRCGYYNGNNERDNRNYKERGITMFEEWVKSPDSFIDWCLENGWQKGLQIDRKNNDYGYYPDNIRFVEPKTNVRNRRSTTKLCTGETLADFCERKGIPLRSEDGLQESNECNRIRNRLHQNPLATEEELLAPKGCWKKPTLK